MHVLSNKANSVSINRALLFLAYPASMVAECETLIIHPYVTRNDCTVWRVCSTRTVNALTISPLYDTVDLHDIQCHTSNHYY